MGQPKAKPHNAFNAPALVGQHPTVAIHQSHGTQVALETIVSQVGIDAERQFDATGIVVRIKQVGSHKMAGKRRTKPVAGLGLDGKMLDLLDKTSTLYTVKP